MDLGDPIGIQKYWKKIVIIAAIAANAVWLCHVLGDTEYGDSFLVWWVQTFGTLYQVLFPHWFFMGPPAHLILFVRFALESCIFFFSLALGVFTWNLKIK